MAKKMEIKTSISCDKCKTDILRAVTSLQGVDQVSIDGDKSMVTVIGDVDPTQVVKKLNKARKPAMIESYGPQKKEEEKKPDKEEKHNKPSSCFRCQNGYWNTGGHYYTVYEL